MTMEKASPKSPTDSGRESRHDEAQRLLAGLRKAREGGSTLRCDELAARLEEHAITLGILDDYKDAAREMWDGPARRVSGDEVAAGLLAGGLEGRDARKAVLFVAMGYLVEALRFADANDETNAWSRAFDALNWEAVLTSSAPGQKIDEILRGASEGGKKGAAQRAKNALNPEAVVREARARGWPDAEKIHGLNSWLSKNKFSEYTPQRIGQILGAELKKIKNMKA